jgi:DNA-binding Xre family transcriptional regulator
MTKLSTVPVAPVATSDSIPFLVVEAGSVSAGGGTQSRPEPSKVIQVAFGEWPTPAVSHPDSQCIADYIRELEHDGFGEQLKQGRKSIADWIAPQAGMKRLRLSAGLSQQELAERMETSQSQIARMESGTQDLKLSTLEKLADVLEIDIYRIIDAVRTRK